MTCAYFMIAKISEIFQSIQGEGPYLGLRQVFVRFGGCNLKCSWCDTLASRNQYGFREYTAPQLLKKVQSLAKGTHSVSITGGEPLLQVDFLKEFLPLLQKSKVKVYLETNGVCVAELKKILTHVDIIAMDIKLPTSTRTKAYWRAHADFLKVAQHKKVFVKAVVTASTRSQDIRRMVQLMRAIDPGILLVLQPGTHAGFRQAVKKALAYQQYCLKYLRDVRVIPQVHKFMKIK